jgi:hypothetical protein
MRAGAVARILASLAGNCPIPKPSGARLRQFRIARFQFHDGGTRKLEGSFRHGGGCGLSLPVLKEGAIPRDAEGAIFHGARAKRIASHLRLCRIRRVYLGINEEQPEVIAGRHEFVFGASKMSITAAYSPPRAALANTTWHRKCAAHLHGMIDGRRPQSKQPQPAQGLRTARGPRHKAC